jgi:penicillin-binding protein 1A
VAEKKKPFDQQKSKYYKPLKSKTRTKRRAVIVALLVLFGLFIVAGGAAASLVINYANEAPPLDPSKLETVETSYLYDRYGNQITALHDEQNRIAVALDEVPIHVYEAFIAIEDERFYEHFGFDIVGSFRAAYANFQAGTIVQGASTITQQLAQSAYLTTETSYERKIQEIWLAIQMERIYAKEEILELYLNRIYFGNGAYGVEAAAKTYFNKSVGDLNIAEAAMLAGIVRTPNNNNPINNKAVAESRMRIVLASMHRLGFINDSQYGYALEHELIYAQAPSPEYPYPHFIDYVVHHELIRILSEMPSIGSRAEAYRAIYTGGLHIYTTLEPPLQLHVEDVLGRAELYPATYLIDMSRAREAVAGLPADGNLTRAQLLELVDEENGVPQPQAAIVVADPATGALKALGGGRDYQKKVDEILRFITLRQPGSAIKPIITYGPAFEEGTLAGAGTTLDDSPYINPRGNWFPENFDYKFRGMLTAREALYKSFNIPAVRAFEALGPRVGAAYAERMGISTLHPSEIDNLSLTLGGFTYGVSAIDMTQAYSVFANNGIKVDLHSVEKIVDRHGEIIYENKITPEQVISPQTAFLINDILQDYITEYLGRSLQIDRPVAAKTGTTDGWKDVYLFAYTPNLVASFWMGYDEPKMGRIQDGWRFSTIFLREVFLEAFKDLEIMEFEIPEDIVRVSVCNKSGLLPNESCQSAESVISDYFIRGRVPAETCTMHTLVFYNRPPYILTDERWSEKGGPGRGPEDVEGILSDPSLFDVAEQSGLTTAEITLFNAYLTAEGITLQWEYNGPTFTGFELKRMAQGNPDDEIIVKLDSNSRQFLDTDLISNTLYTYTLSARFANQELSKPAEIIISTSDIPGGTRSFIPRRDSLFQQDDGPIVLEDYTGLPLAFAEMRLLRAGLMVGHIEFRYDSSSIISGYVIDQMPEAGTTVDPGTSVNLVISQGTRPSQ